MKTPWIIPRWISSEVLLASVFLGASLLGSFSIVSHEETSCGTVLSEIDAGRALGRSDAELNRLEDVTHRVCSLHGQG